MSPPSSWNLLRCLYETLETTRLCETLTYPPLNTSTYIYTFLITYALKRNVKATKIKTNFRISLTHAKKMTQTVLKNALIISPLGLNFTLGGYNIEEIVNKKNIEAYFNFIIEYVTTFKYISVPFHIPLTNVFLFNFYNFSD